jgi:psp operon transcriptional activator
LAVERLHYLSRRWDGPLVALNAAALSPSVVESELFGHEAGAFTGAGRRRIGRFEAADGGTLFLDEIGLVPLTVQEKILRVVEYGRFERVGGSEAVEVDVRIVGATNADLPQLVKEGKFKDDLLDRLSFEVLRLPALRERLEDLELLVRHFATRMALELELAEVPEFSDAAMAAMQAYRWPGNIRELKNVVERAVYRSEGATIRELEFDPFAQVGGVDDGAGGSGLAAEGS